MSELDDFSAPIQTQAPAPTSPLDEFSAPLTVSPAKQKAAVFSNENPEDASSALKIGKQTGIPPSIVQTDLPGYTAHAKTQAGQSAAENPAIASYIDSHPSAAKVSNDDWDTLQKISPTMAALDPQWLEHATTSKLLDQVPAVKEAMETAPGREKLRGYAERFRAGFTGGFGEESDVNKMLREAKDLGLSQHIIDFWEGSGLLPTARAAEAAFRLPGGIVGGAFGLASGAIEQTTGNSAWADRFLRDAPGFNAALLETGGTVHPVAGDMRPLHDFVAEHTPGGPRDLSAGETPKDSLWQSRPIVEHAQAEAASGALDAAVEAAQESKTKERSPELFEEYIKAHGDKGTVSVPAQLILDTYKREGKIPLDGDGLLGFVPGLADKATAAAEAGGDVQIPMRKYIANIDPALHESWKDDVRVNEAKSRAEAKEALEAYHGTPHDFENFDLTKIGTGEGAQVYGHGLYFAENKAVAEDYKKKLAPQRVVDIDLGDPSNPFNKTSIFKPDLEKSQLYKVRIEANPEHLLDWDKSFAEQSKYVQDAITKMANPAQMEHVKSGLTAGESLKLGHYPGTFDINSPEFAKQYSEAGIPGIKYLDQGSRGAGDGTRNFVIFDDKLVKITEKNGNPVVQATIVATEAAKKSLFLDPLIKNGEALNIPQPMFERYSKLIDRAQEQVLTKAVTLEKREAAKRLTPEWKLNETRVRGEVSDDLFASPAWAADRFFNRGEDLQGRKLPPELRVKLGEVPADEYANLFGFETGSEMTTAIISLEQERKDLGIGPKAQFERHTKAETASRMEAQYGHLAENIAIEASEAALSDYNVDILSSEWKMLSDLNGTKPAFTREDLNGWTKDQFSKQIANDVTFEQWRRASEKQGLAAEKALLKGDVKEALKAKQQQTVAFLMAREARVFEKEKAQAEKLFNKYAGDVNLPAVAQRYTDQIHRLLQQQGIDTRRTVENTDYNLRGPDNDLSSFVTRENANGSLIVQADIPQTRPGTDRPIDQFTVDQYRDFATMIKSLDNNGRKAMQIEVAGKREAFNEVIDKVAKNLDGMEKNDFDPDARGVISGLRKLGRAVDSRLLKAEKLIDWVDKKDPLGPFNSSVLRGLIEGEGAKGDMLTKLAKMAGELPGDRAWGKALKDLSRNDELLDWETGKSMKLTNENKIAIALNYGNKSNRDILLKGYKWAEPEVESYLTRELTDMDKKVIDGIHGLFEPLAPHVERVTRERAGVPVPLIEPAPWGGMKGGYYPLMEDPRSKLLGQQVETDLFQKTKFDPLPTANALKQRTGKVYPVDLTIDSINSRLSQTTHAVFMQEPVVNANKVISDPFVREGIAKAFGPEYVKMLDQWVRDIANNGGSDVGFHDDMVTWLSRNLRQNVVTMLMGWKFSTAAIHGGSAGFSSMYEIGKMDGANAKGFILSPVELVKNIKDLGLGQFLPDASRRFFGSQSGVFDGIDFAQNKSAELRNRQRSLAKDFSYQMEKITNDSLVDDAAKLRAVHQTYAMSMVAYLDQLTATPVWKASYDKGLLDGLEDKDAVFIADKAVREAHGSASLVSRANIGRGEVNKWLTIAYNGYWNHNYNKMREAGKEVGGYDDSLSNGQRVAIGAAFTTAMIVAPALIHHAIRGQNEDTLGKATAGALVSQFAGTVPGVNSLTYSMMHNQDPSVSPIEEVFKSVSSVYKDSVAAQPKHQVKHAAQAFGYLTGLPPTNQVIDTFSFMNDVLHQRQDPKLVTEWARGVMTGHAQARTHK